MSRTAEEIVTQILANARTESASELSETILKKLSEGGFELYSEHNSREEMQRILRIFNAIQLPMLQKLRDRLYAEGDEHQDNGRYKDAISRYDTAVGVTESISCLLGLHD